MNVSSSMVSLPLAFGVRTPGTFSLLQVVESTNRYIPRISIHRFIDFLLGKCSTVGAPSQCPRLTYIERSHGSGLTTVSYHKCLYSDLIPDLSQQLYEITFILHDMWSSRLPIDCQSALRL